MMEIIQEFQSKSLKLISLAGGVLTRPFRYFMSKTRRFEAFSQKLKGMYLLIFKTHVLGLLYVPDLDIFGEDVLGDSSTSQADLDLAEMQSKFPPKKIAIFYYWDYLLFF